MERRRNRTFTNMKASAFASAQSLPFAIVCLTKYIKIKKKFSQFYLMFMNQILSVKNTLEKGQVTRP